MLGAEEGLFSLLVTDNPEPVMEANWYTDKPEGKDLPILSLQQLEKDTLFIGLERKATFVDRQGRLKPSALQASQLTFDKHSERMGEY